MTISIEWLGYIASALVAVSLMMQSVLKLRLINLAGAVGFLVYGVLIDAIPVAAVNVLIIVVNLFFLSRIFTNREYFRLLEVSPDSEYLHQFLNFYRDEIQQFIPDGWIKGTEAADQLIIFILRDMVPAGLFVGERRDEDVLLVTLDFVIPRYRDLKIARYLFNNAAFFHQKGIHQLWSKPGTKAHTRYLRRMGFRPQVAPDGDQIYCLSLPARTEKLRR